MFHQIVLKRGGKQEGESPFWISFSDLMSALTVLFLVVMVVTLVTVTKDVVPAEQAKNQRESDIKELMAQVRETSRLFPEVNVNESTYRIDLGKAVLFDSGRADIRRADATFLRRYVPVLLKAQSTDIGKKWIRRVVVEGFTDEDGSYLYNLGLSLNRSKSVVCVLFAQPTVGELPLDDVQKRQIRDLFLVGGYSFNSAKKDKEASRRVEFKIDFWALDEKGQAEQTSATTKEFGQC
ncbi:OmpA family protein [Variovorax sp. LjRoot178]|uniref:OmpA family protein n=1 Tax=Variovorax sp. LjRoot178 TaxID=3342277 RepID=UPI003ECCB239